MRYLTYLFQVIWIIIFPIIGGVVGHAVETSLYWLAILSIVGIFNLVWFSFSSRYSQKEIGIVNSIGNLIILNVPAYLCMIKFFRTKATNASKEGKEDIYKKQNKDNEPEAEKYDFDLTDWEKDILKKRNPKKYKKIVIDEQTENIEDYEVTVDRKIIRGFAVYCMYLIYKQKPDIVNTYQIIQQFKTMTTSSDLRFKLINNFSKDDHLDWLIEDYDKNIMVPRKIEDELAKTPDQEFLVAFNQDRVDIMIDAKNNYYDRNVKSIDKR